MPGVPAEPHPRQTGQGRPGPLISVVMPVHNGARYLDASVGSILARTLADFEFVILDDASDDDTPRLPVVHWADAATVPRLSLAEPSVTAAATATRLTGQHAGNGFCLFRPGPGVAVQPTDPVAAADLHGLIAASLGPR